MEQLIFVGIILLFSILEAVARKGRAQQQREHGEIPQPGDVPPRPAPRTRSRPQAGDVPQSYDQDASFDETVKGDERVTRSRRGDLETARSREGDQAPARSSAEGEATSSEGLIPADVWKEIEALARGGAPPPPTPQAPPMPRRIPQAPRVPRPPGGKQAPLRARPSPPPVTRRAEPVPVPVSGAPPIEGTPDHPVHLSHAAFGTPVQERTAPPLARAAARRPAAAASVRALVQGQRAAVRNAVILQEILGPPAGLRERDGL